MKLAEIDEDGFGASLGNFAKIGQLAATDPLGARLFTELFPNVKAFFGSPAIVRGEAVALVSMLDVRPRPDLLPRKLELEEFARKASSIIEAGPSAGHISAESEAVTQNNRLSELSAATLCSSEHLHDELLALMRSQLSALTQGGSRPYFEALSRMSSRQLNDLVTHRSFLGEGDADSLRHSLDMDHLKALAELANRDENVILALESIVAVQREALHSLDSRSKLHRQLSSEAHFSL